MVKDMTQGSPIKLIFMFSIPLLIGNIFQQLYNMVDAIVVGRFVGVHALAAVGSTSAMTFVILGFSMGLTTGFSVIVSQRFGARDEEGLRRAVAMSILLSVALTVLMTVFSVLGAKPLLLLMDTPADILEQSHRYITIIFTGTFSSIAYNLISSILRALGDSKTPLYFLIVASILNVVLDLIFVVCLGMEVEGVAYATIIAQTCSCVLGLFYIKKKHPILRLSKNDFGLDKEMIISLLKMGVPTALQNSVTGIGVMTLQSAVNSLGSDVVAAFTAASKVDMVASQPISSVGLAMATFVGQNLGAGEFKRIRKGVYHALILIGVCVAFGLTVVYGFGELMTQLFIPANETKVISYAMHYLHIVCWFYVALGTLFVWRSSLQGLGNAMIPMISGVLELFMRMGAALILAEIFGFTGIALASPVAWVAASILLGIGYYRNVSNLERFRRV